MDYIKLKEILNSNNVYDLLKENEEEIFKLIPELKKCKGFNQNNKWHIYDVYEHILHVIKNTESNINLRISALFHDIGKPATYLEDQNKAGHFYNHWNESLKIFNKYQDKFELTKEDISLIKSLIYYHDINIDNMNKEELDLMIEKIGKDNINYLFKLKRADLLSQSSEFHYLLEDINNKEKEIIRRSN